MKNNIIHIIYINLLLIGQCLIVSYNKANAQTDYSEYEVKAGFIYNFTKFVEWPEDAFKTSSSVFKIGILGEDQIGDVLEKTLQGKQIKGRTTVVFRIKKLDDLGLEDYHAVYVSSSEKSSVRKIVSLLKNKPTLIIGNNIEEFCQIGGIINFSSRLTKYGFEINQAGAERSRLTISAKLLSLAQLVKEYGEDR